MSGWRYSERTLVVEVVEGVLPCRGCGGPVTEGNRSVLWPDAEGEVWTWHTPECDPRPSFSPVQLVPPEAEALAREPVQGVLPLLHAIEGEAS